MDNIVVIEVCNHLHIRDVCSLLSVCKSMQVANVLSSICIVKAYPWYDGIRLRELYKYESSIKYLLYQAGKLGNIIVLHHWLDHLVDTRDREDDDLIIETMKGCREGNQVNIAVWLITTFQINLVQFIDAIGQLILHLDINVFKCYDLSNHIIKGRIISLVARYGKRYVLETAITLGYSNYTNICSYAAIGGHQDIIEWILEFGKIECSTVLNHAIMNRRIKIIHLLCSKTKSIPWSVMITAGCVGDMEIINLLETSFGKSYTDLLLGALTGGCKEIVDYAVSKGAIWHNGLINRAILGGNMDLIKLALSKSNYNIGSLHLSSALSINRMDIVLLLEDAHGKFNLCDYNSVIGCVLMRDEPYIEGFELLLNRGVDDYWVIMSLSSTHGHRCIIEMLVDTVGIGKLKEHIDMCIHISRSERRYRLAEYLGSLL